MHAADAEEAMCFNIGLTLITRYRGDRIDGVDDREQQHVVDTPGVVRVSRPGDLLAGGVVDEGGVACDVNLVLCCVRDSVAGAVHVLVLHQGLALLGHHDHVTVKKLFQNQCVGGSVWRPAV